MVLTGVVIDVYFNSLALPSKPFAQIADSFLCEELMKKSKSILI